MLAGPEGLTVLAVGEGSRTGLVWLPRTKQFRIGRRWSPTDSPPPFVAETALGPLHVPELTQRPAHIRNLDELELNEGREGEVLAYATRWLTTREEAKLVLAHDAMPPNTHTTDLHFHTTREEAWYVLSGSGTARIGDNAHELRAGSFWLRRPNGGVGHRVEVGPDGMDLLTMGDLIPGDHAVYPERGLVGVGRGVLIPYTSA